MLVPDYCELRYQDICNDELERETYLSPVNRVLLRERERERERERDVLVSCPVNRVLLRERERERERQRQRQRQRHRETQRERRTCLLSTVFC